MAKFSKPLQVKELRLKGISTIEAANYPLYGINTAISPIADKMEDLKNGADVPFEVADLSCITSLITAISPFLMYTRGKSGTSGLGTFSHDYISFQFNGIPQFDIEFSLVTEVVLKIKRNAF